MQVASRPRYPVGINVRPQGVFIPLALSYAGAFECGSKRPFM
jgi:hypothetical protein